MPTIHGKIGVEQMDKGSVRLADCAARLPIEGHGDGVAGIEAALAKGIASEGHVVVKAHRHLVGCFARRRYDSNLSNQQGIRLNFSRPWVGSCQNGLARLVGSEGIIEPDGNAPLVGRVGRWRDVNM